MENLDQRHELATENLTMTNLNYLHATRVSGSDAGAFLHSQFSADILALADGEATFACYCDPKGKTLAVFLVGYREGEYFLVCHKDLVTSVIRRLQMYVLRSKVIFQPLDQDQVIGLESPSELPAFTTQAVEFFYAISNQQHAHGDSAAWKARELRAGLTWLNSQTSGQFIPQMLNAESIGALSFSKGCYPGQEIVARARYLGKVKRGLIGLALEAEINPDLLTNVELLRNDEWSKGRVVDHATSNGSSKLLILANREPEVPVTKLRWDDKTYRCATM